MPRRLLTFACTATALLATAGAADARTASTRIVNGFQATEQYPAQASIVADGFGGCGGTLISFRWVLTAGHCVEGTKPNPSTPGPVLPSTAFNNAGGIGLGSNTYSPITDAYNVDQVVRMDGYGSSDTPANDVALLRLDTNAPYEPVSLIKPAESALTAPGTQATVIGWGRIGPNENDPGSNDLLQAEVAMRSDAFCGDPSIWGSLFESPSMICAGDGQPDACAGDSGGPLFVLRGNERILAGNVSWGSGECNVLGVPGVYGRLQATDLANFVRTYAPTVDITPATTNPDLGSSPMLTANASHGNTGSTTPVYEWDLDNNGSYETSGKQVPAPPINTPAVRRYGVRTTYPNQDGATSHVTLKWGAGVPTAAATAAPVVSGTPADKSVLTTTNGNWSTNTGGLHFLQQWQRCDKTATTCTDIEGAAGPRYTARTADGGFYLRSVVRAVDFAGTSPGVPSNLVKGVAADPPALPPTPRPISPVKLTIGTLTRTVRFKSLRSGFVAARYSCTIKCRFTATLTVSTKTRRSLKLKKRTVATARSRDGAFLPGSSVGIYRFSAEIKKALKNRRKSFKITVKTRLVAGQVVKKKNGTITAKR